MAASPEQIIAEALSPVDPTRRIPAATARDIEDMADQAADILKEAIAAAIEPEQRKVLRKWNLKEVAELLGLSRKTLERGIDDGKLPGGERVATGRRLFSLEEIHKIQEILGILPWRNADTDVRLSSRWQISKAALPKPRPPSTWASILPSGATAP